MSRIGKRILTLPEGVTATVNDNTITVKGPKGELNYKFSDLIDVVVKDNEVETKQKKKTKNANIMQGTTNALINNMIIGVSKGFTKGLEIVGVGYRFNVQGQKLTINAGYSNPVIIELPSDLKATLVSNTEITIEGIDKQKVTEFAADIRKIREPEPYKGKGIRYKDEHVRRKEGKKAA